MRILALAYTNYSSDPRVLREAEAFAQAGDEIDVFCLRKPGEKPKEQVRGVTIRHLPIKKYQGNSTLQYIISYFSFMIVAFLYVTLFFIIKRYKIIHIHTMPDFLIFAAVVPRICGAKLVLDMHDLMPEVYEAKFGSGGFYWSFMILVEKLSTKFAHHIITVHEPYVELIKSRGVHTNKITAILNVPEQEIFHPRTVKPGNPFTVIYSGTIAKRNGIDIFLHALNILKKDDLPIRFLLIGDGDDLPKIKKLAADLQLGDTLQLNEGFVDVRELPSYIQMAHMAVIPLRADTAMRYALPVKLMEYVSMEVPVVISYLETISAYFDDDMVSFVPPENIFALADAVKRLYLSKQLRDRLARNASRFTKTHNWDLEREKLYKVFDLLIDDYSSLKPGNES